MVKFVISESGNDRLSYRLIAATQTAPKIFTLQIEIVNVHDQPVRLDRFFVTFMSMTPELTENFFSVSMIAKHHKHFLNMKGSIQLPTQCVDPHFPTSLSILSRTGFIGMEKNSKDTISLNIIVALGNENGPDIAIVFSELNFQYLPDLSTHQDMIFRGEDAAYRHVFKKIRFSFSDNRKMFTTLFNIRNDRFLDLILKNLSLWDIQYLLVEDLVRSPNRSDLKNSFVVLKKNYDDLVGQLANAIEFVIAFIKKQSALDADISLQIPEQPSAYSVIKLLGEIGYEGDFTTKVADLEDKKDRAKAELRTEFVLHLDSMKKILSDKIQNNILSTNMIKAWALLTKKSVRIWSNHGENIYDKNIILKNIFSQAHPDNSSPLHYLVVNNINFYRITVDYLIKKNVLGPILPLPSSSQPPQPICNFDLSHLRI